MVFSAHIKVHTVCFGLSPLTSWRRAELSLHTKKLWPLGCTHPHSKPSPSTTPSHRFSPSRKEFGHFVVSSQVPKTGRKLGPPPSSQVLKRYAAARYRQLFNALHAAAEQQLTTANSSNQQRGLVGYLQAGDGHAVGGEVGGPRVGHVLRQSLQGALAGGGVLADEADEGNHGQAEGGKAGQRRKRSAVSWQQPAVMPM